MNKNDLKLVLGLLAFSVFMIWLIVITKNTDQKTAKVYFENDLVLTIPLSQESKSTHKVNGFNGEVVIEVDNDKIRVIQEKSPLHLCSKQGWIKETYETIVCLPNKVVIEIEAADDVDAVIK